MTEKEVGELRRRLRPDRTNITSICGCYVSAGREILSRFTLSMGLLSEEDKEHYLSIFKRVLSGAADKNRLDLAFQTAQVADSDEHRLLMTLRNSKLQDEAALNTLYEKLIGSVLLEGQFVILLAHESYDVPFKSKDGALLEDGSDVFSYVLCAICPVKEGKSSLSYDAQEKQFHNATNGSAVAAPEIGFLFPCFDGRSTNIYNVLYYVRSGKNNHEEVCKTLFAIDPPAPAESQRVSFGGILTNALGEECSLALVQSVDEELRQRIAIYKESRGEEPLAVYKEDVHAVLQDHGVSEAHLASFNTRFEESFGVNAAVSPRNLVGSRKFEVKTPDVVISVNPERSDLVETRIIGGVQYLLIRADESVEVNGVSLAKPKDE